MTGCTARRYDQFETSPEAIEQELRPAVCEHRQTDRQTDRLKANYSIDYVAVSSTTEVNDLRYQLLLSKGERLSPVC